MATYAKVPGWIQRRISERPAARWIVWNAGRPRPTETTAPLPPTDAATAFGDNVVFLFGRTA